MLFFPRLVRNRISKGCLIVLWCSILLMEAVPGRAQNRPDGAPASAERYSFDFRGASVDEAVQRLITVTHLGVAYSNALVAGYKTTCSATQVEAETILRCILEGLPLAVERLASGAFVIKPAPPPRTPAASSAGPPGTRSRPNTLATLRGLVREKETRLPLEGANIVVVGTPRGTASGPDGQFAMGLPPGEYVLEVSMIGYETQRTPVVLREREAVEVTVALDVAFTPLREVIVTPGHFSLLHRQTTTRQVLTRDAIERLPALGDDVYRVVQRLPGLAGHDFSAGFNVRGGEHREVLVLLDGMELYEPFHLKDIAGGFFSIIDIEAIGGVDVMTGAFPVEYGNRLSGVFNIESATPPRDYRRTSMGLSLSNVRFSSEGRFADGKGQWLAVARRGYIDLLLKLIGESDQVNPTYYDLYTKVQYQLTPNHALSVHLLGAEDRITFIDGTEFTLDANYGNTYAWATWKATLHPRLFARTLLSVGRIARNRTGIDYFSDTDGAEVFRVDDQRSFTAYGLKQDWTYEPGDRLLFKAGVSIRHLDASYRYENRVRENEAPSVAFDSTQVRLRPAGTEGSAYLGARIQVARPLTAELGLRYDRASWTQDQTLSPRFNLAYRLGPKTAVRAGWGRFYQTQGIHALDVQDGDDRYHPAALAEHRVLGVEHLVADAVLVRLEAYHKKLSNQRPAYLNLPNDVLYSFPEAEPGRVRLLPERGTTKGVELFVKKDTGGTLSGQATYSLAFADDEIDGVTIPRHYDQRHTIYLDLGYRPRTAWSLNLAWTYHSGWPYTASTFAPIADDDGGFYFVSVPAGPVNAERLPAYHRLDLRLSRHFTFAKSRLSVFVDVQNLYNRKNVRLFVPTLTSVSPDGAFTVRNVRDHFLPLLPSLGLRWDLFH